MADERWHEAVRLIAQATRSRRRDLNVLKQAAELQLAAVLETVKDADPRAELLLALGREAALAAENRQLEQQMIARNATIAEKDEALRAAQAEIDRLKADRQTAASI